MKPNLLFKSGLKVVHSHALRIAFRTIISSAILEVADQLVSRPAGLHRQSLAERCVRLSPHTAPIGKRADHSDAPVLEEGWLNPNSFSRKLAAPTFRP